MVVGAPYAGAAPVASALDGWLGHAPDRGSDWPPAPRSSPCTGRGLDLVVLGAVLDLVLHGPVTPDLPASLLRTHARVTCPVDADGLPGSRRR